MKPSSTEVARSADRRGESCAVERRGVRGNWRKKLPLCPAGRPWLPIPPTRNNAMRAAARSAPDEHQHGYDSPPEDCEHWGKP